MVVARDEGLARTNDPKQSATAKALPCVFASLGALWVSGRESLEPNVGRTEIPPHEAEEVTQRRMAQVRGLGLAWVF